MTEDARKLLLQLEPYFLGKDLSRNDIPSLIIGAGGSGLPIRMAIMESVEARHFVFATDFRDHFHELALAPVHNESMDLHKILETLDVPRLNVIIVLPDQVVKELSVVDMPRLLEKSLMELNIFPIRPTESFDEVLITTPELKTKPKNWQKPLKNTYNNRAFQTQKRFMRKK